MSYLDFSEKVEHLISIMEKGRTGNPEHIARHLIVSERTVRRMVVYLRLKGYKIRYCRQIESYVLEQ